MDWALAALAALPAPLCPGNTLSLAGETKRLVARPDAQRGVWLEGTALHVSGAPEHFRRRLRDWLVAHANDTLPALLTEHSQRHGLHPSAIALRDVQSRWGSCTPQGRIMLSWRLILAPPPVCTYVMLHELAHLRHFNHGPDFWALLDALLLKGETDRRQAEKWLHANGSNLLALI